MSDIPEAWPTNESQSNLWNYNATEFLTLVKSKRGFWCVDPDLKYLNVRVDTRNDNFILVDDDKNRIDVSRALEAMRNWPRIRKPIIKAGSE